MKLDLRPLRWTAGLVLALVVLLPTAAAIPPTIQPIPGGYQVSDNTTVSTFRCFGTPLGVRCVPGYATVHESSAIAASTGSITGAPGYVAVGTRVNGQVAGRGFDSGPVGFVMPGPGPCGLRCIIEDVCAQTGVCDAAGGDIICRQLGVCDVCPAAPCLPSSRPELDHADLARAASVLA